ncbi:phenylalanine--tRNA ligase subunit alpha [Patescibacteria group bacterium]
MNEQEVNNLQKKALAQIIKCPDPQGLEKIRVSFLGRKGKISLLLKDLKNAPPQLRGQLGQQLNKTKNYLTGAISNQRKKFLESETKNQTWFDVTLPGIKPEIGHLHLISQAIEEISQIFDRIGFTRVRHPEIEWDWYSFEALNMPANHPARDDFQAFYIEAPTSPKGKMVLTPHTSSGQIREMKAHKPPIRMINIGRCYRPEYDVRHAPVFHQFEGLYINKQVSITHLKGMLSFFAEEFFGPERKIRLRPYDFRFTEPSFEVDITCALCQGKGCRLCKEGWLELGGSGMVHPVVLKNGGINPQEYSGFAFGWGVERVMMMKAGLKLPDLRLLWSPDLRLLNQF